MLQCHCGVDRLSAYMLQLDMLCSCTALLPRTLLGMAFDQHDMHRHFLLARRVVLTTDACDVFYTDKTCINMP